MVTANPPHQTAHSQWAVSYTQSDVDTIREQIEQNEAAKRRWLFLALMITVAALVGVVILMSSSYALYSKSESDKRKLSDENAGLKTARRIRNFVADTERDFLAIRSPDLRRLQNASLIVRHNGLQQRSGERQGKIAEAYLTDLRHRNCAATAAG